MISIVIEIRSKRDAGERHDGLNVVLSVEAERPLHPEENAAGRAIEAMVERELDIFSRNVL
jgi:hypothetical protein